MRNAAGQKRRGHRRASRAALAVQPVFGRLRHHRGHFRDLMTDRRTCISPAPSRQRLAGRPTLSRPVLLDVRDLLGRKQRSRGPLVPGLATRLAPCRLVGWCRPRARGTRRIAGRRPRRVLRRLTQPPLQLADSLILPAQLPEKAFFLLPTDLPAWASPVGSASCGCDSLNGYLPGSVLRGTFGSRLVALVGILSGCYRFSKRTVVAVLEDLSEPAGGGLSLSYAGARVGFMKAQVRKHVACLILPELTRNWRPARNPAILARSGR